MSEPIPPRPDVGWGTPTLPPPQEGTEPAGTTATWTWWEALLVGLLGFIVVGGILGAIAAVVLPRGPLRTLGASLAVEAGLAATVVAWVRWLHRRSAAALRFHPRKVRDMILGALSGLVVYAGAVFGIGTVILILLSSLTDRTVRSPKQLPDRLDSTETILAGIFVIVAAPIAEELFFRGFLFNALRARRRFFFAASISALAFGAAHWSPGRWDSAVLLVTVMIFVGFGFAYIYERFGNLAANMAAHAAFNTIGFLFIVLT